jgi:hypothetical protein
VWSQRRRRHPRLQDPTTHRAHELKIDHPQTHNQSTNWQWIRPDLHRHTLQVCAKLNHLD